MTDKGGDNFMERLRRFLGERRQKTILLDELQQFCCKMEYEEFRQYIRQLETEEVLQPIKAAGQDFGGLSYKYRVSAGKLFSAAAEEIQWEIQRDAMSSRLDFTWYYRQPMKCWQQERPYLKRLSSYFKQQGSNVGQASVQQRSYEIFGDEKFLLEKGHALLGHVRISEADLGIGGQADPLMLAVNPGGLQQRLCHHLAVENKAAYYGLLPVLKDTLFASLIFGSGWKIVGNLSELPRQCGKEGQKHVVWYFGDFDWEGLSIWHALLPAGMVEVRLAGMFYQAFLSYAASSGKQNQQKNPAALEAFCQYFSAADTIRWHEILRGRGYYPQETLGAEELQKGWEKLCDEAGKFS